MASYDLQDMPDIDVLRMQRDLIAGQNDTRLG